jgi:urease gamma subunit
MIYIRAAAHSESDVPPIVRIYQYSDGDDELILEHSAAMVQEKLGKGLKVNVNEAMLLYCYHVMQGMRAGAVDENTKVLAADQAMVGVAETLRTIVLDAVVDGRRKVITLKEPIPPTGYAMAARP